MLNESLPLVRKYWRYMAVSIISFVIGNIIMQMFKRIQRIYTGNDLNGDTGSGEVKEDHYDCDVDHVPYKDYVKFPTSDMIARSRDFYKTINLRRSVRKFSPEPVPKEIIENIIKAAGTSPSGAHTQPWTFAVVSNPRLKMEIREIVETEEEINYKKRMGIKWVNDLKKLKTNWIKEYLTTAPYLILVFQQMHSFTSDGDKRVHYYKEISVNMAAGILITAIQLDIQLRTQLSLRSLVSHCQT
ncbi:iodotyrosine deiodinase 1 isoform X2 [Cephus cinctus]|uniref:Iodotyrosine deiodinase 1 isoform X2 n=1 Tax=Cephus cinctus TaxID=211228 RepID=A0AAJ7C2J7_CEPCN|nr:iodotyrosine deiodinase 1 isoform X2 [Cephus cinctus]